MTGRLIKIVCVVALQGILAGCQAPRVIQQPSEVLQPPSVIEEKSDKESMRARLHVYVNEFRLVYHHPEEFAMDVHFENIGRQPLVVLPALLHRQYRPLNHTTATYVPYPGPRLSPWSGAFTLLGGETRVVRLSGMRDGDGVWALDYGNYRLLLTYLVTEQLAEEGTAAWQQSRTAGARVWVGEVHSRPIAVRYEARD